MVIEFNSIRMDAESKKKKKKQVEIRKEYHACRVLPFSVARLGAEGVGLLPLVTILPQRGADLKVILGKRRRIVSEIIKEIFGDTYGF